MSWFFFINGISNSGKQMFLADLLFLKKMIKEESGVYPRLDDFSLAVMFFLAGIEEQDFKLKLDITSTLNYNLQHIYSDKTRLIMKTEKRTFMVSFRVNGMLSGKKFRADVDFYELEVDSDRVQIDMSARLMIESDFFNDRVSATILKSFSDARRKLQCWKRIARRAKIKYNKPVKGPEEINTDKSKKI